MTEQHPIERFTTMDSLINYIYLHPKVFELKDNAEEIAKELMSNSLDIRWGLIK